MRVEGGGSGGEWRRGRGIIPSGIIKRGWRETSEMGAGPSIMWVMLCRSELHIHPRLLRTIPLSLCIIHSHYSDPTLYRRRPQRCPKPTGSSGRTRLRSKCVGLADVWGQLVHHAVCLEVSFMTLVAFPLPSLPSPPLLHSPRLGGDRLPGVCSAPLFPSLSLNSPPSPPFPPLGGDRLSRQAQDMGL